MFTEIIHGYEIGKKECLRETIPSVVNGDRPQFGKVRVIRILHDTISVVIFIRIQHY